MWRRKALIALAAAVLAATQSDAAELCPGNGVVTTARSGQLIDLTNQIPLQEGSEHAVSKRSSIRLGYVVPGSENLTGALVVKVRHRWLPDRNGNGAFPGANFIRLERPVYTSPCDSKDRIAYGPREVRLEHYVDRHYYGLPHSSMSGFHADVGHRPYEVSYGLFTRPTTVCRRTSDDAIRGQFLYSDRVAIADEREVATRRADIGRTPNAFIGAAFAEPSRYKDKLQTYIIPYRKRDMVSPHCFAFGITVPERTVSTDVSVIDADAGYGSAFQTTWKLSWRQN